MREDGFMAEKKNPLGPTGRAVAANVRRLRGAMQYKELAERLEVLGRPIPTLGLRRLESEERRVDADDLAALALALGVTPNTLLMPDVPSGGHQVGLTGIPDERATAQRVWLWLSGEVGPRFDPSSSESYWENSAFVARSAPLWATDTRSTGATALSMLTPEAKAEVVETALREVGAGAEHGDD